MLPGTKVCNFWYQLKSLTIPEVIRHPIRETQEHRVTYTRTRLLVLVSPPHQVRTAADTASEDDSCGHRRCWTAAASKGFFCLVCVVLVLVAVRFASWTMMCSVFRLMISFCFFLGASRYQYSYSFRRRTKCVRLLTPQAITYTPFCPCLIGLPHTRSGSPLTSSTPLPVMLRAV